ncbi:polycystic kidney disease protein 1-like 2 [Trematomus bernacchii]|uniref:polycystic kidney disease protein 1-like 2 n=1 Tax=Trematomus bernacchii TaxID=40690 RepID=UPI00146E7295|nr:polycystic kidney disease protein 1-like 2 [Trematomus bernacchii]
MVLWNIEAPKEKGQWLDEVKDIHECYKETKRLINPQKGGIEYTVDHKFIKKAKRKQDITVVITSVDVNLIYTTFIVIKSTTPDPDNQNPEATTAGNGDGATNPAGPASTSPATISQSSTIPNNPTTVGSTSTSPSTIGQSSTTPNNPNNPTTIGPASTSPGTISHSSTTPNNPTTVGSDSTSPATIGQSSTIPNNPATVGPASTSPSTLSGTTITPYNPTTLTNPITNDPASTTASFVSNSNTNPNSPTSPTTPYTNGPATTLPGTMGDNTATLTTANPSDTSPSATNDNNNLKCKHLLCSNTNEVKSAFLPLGNSSCNFTLIIKATAKNSSYEANTTITAEVLDYTENDTSSVDGLKVAVDKAVALLKKQGLLSGQNVGQIFSSVSKKLNSQSDEANKANRQKGFNQCFAIRLQMLSIDKNPFAWHEGGNISGVTAALSLTTTNGSSIAVENLSENIKILLPRPVGEQVNTSFLDLGNFSTTIIEVASADSTLVLKMVPSNDPLPFKILLGYMDFPTETNNVAMTEMPHDGATQEERYTWLLDPNDLKGNTGVHYLVVRPIVGPGIKSINATLSITPISAACRFWDESNLDWSTNGCKVGVHSTHLVTECLCNHLTFFGSSFFVTPNLVDPSRTAELFATFAENPLVVCFVASLFGAYLLVVLWARRKDIKDTVKVKLTVLGDNDPMDEYRYLLSVSTGHRRGAATSSKVIITLMGSEGSSEPHHLTDSKKCVFERGAVDLFLLTTPFPLGDLQSIRLWHNNSGSHPAWYVGNVMLQDLQKEQKCHFLCNSWLAIDIGGCSLDQVFPVSTEVDLKRFSNLFFMKTSKDFSDGHLWYSVINRPPSSNFTCVQRVSCCFTLLLCTMLTSVMFYGIPTDPSEQTMDMGLFEFTWQQFMIGVQSSLIMFPVNILIVSIFRNTRPRETSCCKRKTEKPDAEQTFVSPSNTNNMSVNVTLDTVIMDIKRIAQSLSKTMKSNIPCTESEFGPAQQVDINAVLSTVEHFITMNDKASDTTQPELEYSPTMHPGSTLEGIQKKSNKNQYLYRQLCHIDKQLSQLGPSDFPDPHSYSRALQQVHGMKVFLEDQLFTSGFNNPEEPNQKKLSPEDSTDGDGNRKKRGLPWWFIFVGWALMIASSFVSGYFTMLYGLKFGKERSASWLVSMIVSFFQSILVIQPLKVIFLAIFFALVIKKVDEEDFQNVAFERNYKNLGDCKEPLTVRRDNSLYVPPAAADIEKMKRYKIMEQKAFALLKEILTYMGFMWMLLLVAYGEKDPNAFFLKRHIRDSFSQGTKDSMSPGDVFTWANTLLLKNLFGVYPGFITDGNSKLVGNARLRQLRVQKNSCQIAGYMQQFVPDCHAPYSWDLEDMGSYDPGWNHLVKENVSRGTFSPWTYQTQTQLRAHPFWGKMVLYRGGGFVAEIGPDSQNASRTLEYLFRNTWLDAYTRAIFVEFTVYNANVNLFCIVTLLLETTAVGAFQFYSELQSVRLYQSTGGLHIFVLAAEIIYLLFILYYMFLQAKLMKQQRCAYLRSTWNLLELSIILLSWSTLAIYINRTLLGNRDITYYQNHKDQFANFYETASADSLLQYMIAFLVLLSTFKLWHLLRLNAKMNMLTAALQRAWSDVSGLLLVIVVMFVAYSISSNVIYGWKVSSYKTLTDALLTLISLQIGIFNYNEVLDNTPVLGGLLFGSCIVFMTFVVLNLLLSVILVAFHQEQIYHKPSDEEEIVDLMLKKICKSVCLLLCLPRPITNPSSVFLHASSHTCPSLLALVSSGSPAHLVCVPPCFSAHLLQPARSRKLCRSPASDLHSTLPPPH